MGIFDFLKSDKHKGPEAADKAKEQAEQQAAAGPAPSAMGGKYTDAAAATKAAADRMAASAPPKPPVTGPASPSPASAAHKAVPVTPRPPAASASRPPVPPKPPAAARPASPSPASAAHKAVPVPPKQAPAAKKRTYTVKPGDSLSAIARHELGNEARWRELYAMNRGVVGANPDLIHPGTVLTLPN
ncbi:LysM domain-containing protein [Streptomyces sp. NPDC029003]|uniref:LysM peptidoglycan-binding domain-containing protein n=1 Tax=Streptomyces sp. NPDC029003 TaxID=3155125 RepID=UPI0034118137